LAENPRAVRRTVNPNRDRDEPEMLAMLEVQAMLEVLAMWEILEVLEVLDCHGSRTGTVFATSPGLTFFRSSALPVKGLELVVEKRRRCGDLTSESALVILQKTPPAMVLTQDQTHATASIYSPSADTNFLELHYVKDLKKSARQP
jgi:hypothetical protein